ncbi:MAG: PilX N-terminal domain-containing pilus assembly protein [Pseudomonas sp.]|uniref:PilX N-terminal domain-containing pilus assembly protein n=1 Tax=Pseudomonas sp. TaxID=306 RepID=UPI00299D3AA4|nr:PilX N-terminal domain-containing pilus assembly protein [Pseudomonas sp.]MDX1725239.1 PilX N-terminal domain-containing pilus assembly protein [Pseudomonas sp.]
MKQLKTPRQQSGVVLAVSLILLLLLTILAITASTSSTLQERMAANAQESNVAFQASESALAAMNTQVRNGIVPAADSVLALDYPTRTVRARMQSASRYAEGSSLDAEENSGTPQIIIYDFTSSATLDPAATTAGQITNSNTNARHLQGYRDRIIQ